MALKKYMKWKAAKEKTYLYNIRAISGHNLKERVVQRYRNGAIATQKDRIILYFILNEKELTYWWAAIYEKCDENSQPKYLHDEFFLRYSQMLGFIKPSDPYPLKTTYPFNAKLSDYPIESPQRFGGIGIKRFGQPGQLIEYPAKYPLL